MRIAYSRERHVPSAQVRYGHIYIYMHSPYGQIEAAKNIAIQEPRALFINITTKTSRLSRVCVFICKLLLLIFLVRSVPLIHAQTIVQGTSLFLLLLFIVIVIALRVQLLSYCVPVRCLRKENFFSSIFFFFFAGVCFA